MYGLMENFSEVKALFSTVLFRQICLFDLGKSVLTYFLREFYIKSNIVEYNLIEAHPKTLKT